MSQPRLLILTHRFPYPPNRGDRIRSYHFLRALATRYRVTLGSANDEPLKDEHRQHIEELCEDVYVGEVRGITRCTRGLRSLASGRSITEGMFYHVGLERWLTAKHTEQPFDQLLIYCSNMYGYIRRCGFESIPTWVDLVDVDSQKWLDLGEESNFAKRLLYRQESNRVRRLERQASQHAKAISVISDDEARVFKQAIGRPKNLTVIANGVDTSSFQPGTATAQDTGSPPSQTCLGRGAGGEGPITALNSASSVGEASSSPIAPLKLLFVGVLDYEPNIDGLTWFCNEVMPHLNASSPGRVEAPASERAPTPPRPIHLTIVGRRPTRAIQSLASPHVDVIGEVDDVRDYLHDCDVVIAPLRVARGVQNKVLEAMACGKPVIATTAGSTGISAAEGKEILIADRAKQWAKQITQLQNDPDSITRIGNQARKLVETEYGWQTQTNKLLSLLENNENRSENNENRSSHRESARQLLERQVRETSSPVTNPRATASASH